MSPFVARLLSIFILSPKKRKKFRKDHTSNVARRYARFHRKYYVGIGSYFGENCHIADKRTTIGNFCSIASGVLIGTTRHPLNFLSTHPFQYMDVFGIPGEIPESNRRHYQSSAPLSIGNDVWIGAGAMLMDGICVGDGAVIGGGAVVTKDVPPYAIVGGVPAKIIRYRFPAETIEKLLKLRWWDLPLTQIRDLPFDDIDACILKLQEIRQSVQN